MLDKQRSSSTIKVYAAAITAFHAPIADRSVDSDSAEIKILRGARRMNPPRPCTVPPWDLPTVLRPLKWPPLEPLQSTSLRALSLKNALLLALASVMRVGDLQALSINPVCLEFGPNVSKVVLKPRLGYGTLAYTLGTNVISTPFRAQVIALSPSTGSQELSLLCLSGPWGYTLSVLPHTGNQNSCLSASVTTPKVAPLRSKEFLGG